MQRWAAQAPARTSRSQEMEKLKRVRTGMEEFGSLKKSSCRKLKKATLLIEANLLWILLQLEK